MARSVVLVLCLAGRVCARAAHEVFPDVPCHALSREELRPRAPFAGPLFDVLAGLSHGSCVGLVVPVRPVVTAVAAAAPRGTLPHASASPRVAAPASPTCTGVPAPPLDALVSVCDHVNLELRGPLTGRWPAGVPRAFPQVAGIYQPALVRASGEPRVYSSGVVVAGVADARRLTPFEARAVADLGVIAVSDVLVPAAIVAAYYGLTLAACGVPQADDNDEQ